MGKKDIRVIPWKYVVTMQFVLVASCVTQTVTSPQYITPFAPFFTKATTSLSWDEVGYLSGSLAGSYLLGRTLSTPFWVYLADICGRRAVLSMCFMFSLVLTMFFGLCSTLLTAVIVRFCLGLFAPAYVLAQSMLKELASPCMEDLPSVSIATTITTALSQVAAILVGSLLVPDINQDPLVQRFLFLTPSLICAAATLFAFIAFFVDFPETLPLALELKKRAKQAAAQPTKRPAGKYVELAETGNAGNEEMKAETHGDVLTERKEHIDDEEELPNYLMHLAQQKPEVMEEIPEEKDSMSKRLVRFFSPRHADGPKVNVGIRPNTARANTFAHPLPELDEPKEQIEVRKSQVPVMAEPKAPGEKEEIKRTHISFFEEDFDPAEMSGAAQSATAATAPTLGDKYRRKEEGGVWSSPPFCLSLAQSFLLTLCIVGVREAVVIWLVVESTGMQLSVIVLGLVLAGSEGCGRLLQAVLMPRMTFYHPLNQLGTLVCILLALATVAIPFSDTLQSSISAKLAAFFLLALFEYLSSFSLTISVLKVSDSVSPELRESAMRWSAGICGIARAGGSVGGPALFAAALTGALGTDYHWLFLGVAGVLLGVAALMLCDKRRFPRLNESPYEV